MTKLNVLDDKGYVRLVDVLGNDLSIVNAARVSYDKESNEFENKDEKLINFLIREGHTSPLRHAALTFEIYAPLMVARQWWKYAVASSQIDDQNGWNESSRRYITEKEEFYIPENDVYEIYYLFPLYITSWYCFFFLYIFLILYWFFYLMQNVLLNWSHILSASISNIAATQTMKDAETHKVVYPSLKAGLEYENGNVFITDNV